MTSRNSVTRLFDAAADATTWLGVDDVRRAIAFLIASALMTVLVIVVAIGPVWRAYAWIPSGMLRGDRLRITHALATRWLRDTPDILIVGGSQMREIVPEDDFISARLSDFCGRPVRVLNAASSSQLLETSWAIIEHFGSHPPAHVVIGANLWRNTHDMADPDRLARSLFTLPPPRDMPRGLGNLNLPVASLAKARLGILFSDTLTGLGWYGARPHAGSDPFNAPQHAYAGPPLDSIRKSMDARYFAMQAAQLPEAVLANNVEAYRLLASSMTRQGSRVTFVLTPVSPESSEAYRSSEPRVAAATKILSGAGTVVDLRSPPDLTSVDFFDTVHLLASGRHKLWPTLRSDLLAGLAGCRSEVPHS